MRNKRCTAIVLAAGNGSRMKSDVAKQYMLLQDKPLIWYALHTIEESSVIDDCILVTGAEDISYVQKEIVTRYGFRKVDTVIAGGEQRYDSVWNALQVIAGGGMSVPNTDGYVFIHDGARPFLTEEILRRIYEAVKESGACVTGMPTKDTIKISDEEGYAKQTPDRKNVWQIQTPQAFETRLITDAYVKLMKRKEERNAEGIGITDDAMVVENFTGHKVKLVQGSYENIKITTPEDLVIAGAFLKDRKFCNFFDF
ncbi:MAG: 2-C-methyl-D-erythritol 4-phosphate cytidylyltransferase [Lachnospiraceae bacterium]|nr:2-C-methyl-D-erythritol 4-phosphate cytidylyltransferase [Lachnospiraceae bacterium]